MRKVIKKKINFKANINAFLSIFFILAMALLIVHIRVLTDNLKYENRDRDKEEKELLKENEHFKRELESLKSPSKIEREAMRLGMKYPEKWQIKEIKLKKNGA